MSETSQTTEELAALFEVLKEALDEGQEIEMCRFWSPAERRHEYRVRIFGDCWLQEERPELMAAIDAVAAGYLNWQETADEDDEDDEGAIED